MSRFLLAVVGLTLVYALVLASFDPWDLAIGALFAGGLLWTARGFVFGNALTPVAGLPWRLLWFVPFVGAVIWEILRGTLLVTLVVLHLRPLNHPGLVALPFDERTRLGVAVWALAVTISPGSFPVDFDWNRRVMLVHFLDASDPDRIRAEQRGFYLRYQRRVFP